MWPQCLDHGPTSRSAHALPRGPAPAWPLPPEAPPTTRMEGKGRSGALTGKNKSPHLCFLGPSFEAFGAGHHWRQDTRLNGLVFWPSMSFLMVLCTTEASGNFARLINWSRILVLVTCWVGLRKWRSKQERGQTLPLAWFQWNYGNIHRLRIWSKILPIGIYSQKSFFSLTLF